MFNAVRVSLEGKIASVREGMQGQIASVREGMQGQRDELEGRVAQVERQGCPGRSSRGGVIRRTRRGVGWQASRSRLAVLGADIVEDRVRLCFGSKWLWRKQYHLRSNGYSGREGVARGLAGSPGAASSSCLVAGMRPVVASFVWPRWLMMAV